MTLLRHSLSELMVRVNRISPDLADSHVQAMSDAEVEWRFRQYAEGVSRVSGPVPRVADGAIGNLSIDGMESRAGKQDAHAGSKEFPRRGPERGEGI